MEALSSSISVRCISLIGRLDMMAQAIALGKKPHIIVAALERLLDHVENTRGFSLQQLKCLVLDEADRLLDLDFGPMLDKIPKVLPKRTAYLFSATMSRRVESLQRASLTNPVRVSTSTKHQTASKFMQSYMFFQNTDKDIYPIHTLSKRAGQMAIIFTRTINETQRISTMLPATPLPGQLPRSVQLAALNKFQSGSLNPLIATDVAARELDMPSADLIINYNLL